MRETDVVNIKTVLRIVQSISSPNAEPFKQWPSKVGAESIQEIKDPEIAVQRAITAYKAAGHDDEWINKRLKTILGRKDLTGEWQRRAVL
jgi:DNA-damage-inducible protein D